MGAAEIVWRARDAVLKHRWRRRWLARQTENHLEVPAPVAQFPTPLPAGAVDRIHPDARRRLMATADTLLGGHWPIFASCRDDMIPAPDWFSDPGSGIRASEKTYCFDIGIRRDGDQRSLKHIWELSRHHHCTVLAAAYHLTGDERYASAASAQLRSWWADNPFLSGVHWTSAIEVGIRLVSWVWVRRLLDGWRGAGTLFERNPVFLRQLHDHQTYLGTFRSYGTSANNHLLAEMAGQFAASCAFPYFDQTRRWRTSASSMLEREIGRQTFPSGLHRELASTYHAFVLELCLAAALEGEASGHPLSEHVWDVLRRMVDAAAAVVDVRLRPPRQGDSDDGHGLLLDSPHFERWASLLATGAVLFGRADWWPQVSTDDVRTPLWTALTRRRHPAAPRPGCRPQLTDAGMVVLRAESDGQELWCRLDHGPHGYVAIAAHAHADALAIELRAGGVEIMVDPGTYCYQGDPKWRTYFRSTLAHNTLEVGGCDQSVSEGTFLWTRHARARLEYLSDGAAVSEWHAMHDGYRRLRPPATHHRIVRLHHLERRLEIRDRLDTAGRHHSVLAFHLGPEVSCSLEAREATLTWTSGAAPQAALLTLPDQLTWRCVRGGEDPPLGWYSPKFGVRVPVTALLGAGTIGGNDVLLTTVQFLATPHPVAPRAVAQGGVQL